MKLKILLLAAVVLIIAVAAFAFDRFGVRPSPPVSDASLSYIQLPEGFSISVFAENLGGSRISTPGVNPGPRLMTEYQDGILVSLPRAGAVVYLADTDADGKADINEPLIEGLNGPHGLAVNNGWVYIAEENQVIRIKGEQKEVLVPLPASAGHSTRTIKIIDNKLYVATGSSCNVCVESEKERAAILECTLDGKECSVFAKGLRNTVDFIERNGKIYGTDNSRDNLGNDIPPDEINIIERDNDYGWPYCYGNNIQDLNFDQSKIKRCIDTVPPFVELQAHSAPLGLAAYTGSAFPAEYRGDLFVAYHGSWNRQPATGYKIVSIDLATKGVTDFASGWLSGSVVKGRPVGILNYDNGLLITDDNQGKIYFISYSGS